MIAATALLGWWVLGLAPAAALLFGSALVPTDPVLASDVQVGQPGGAEQDEDEVRFALTSEAELNDALAFPFVYAAIAVAPAGTDPFGWVGGWLLSDVLYATANAPFEGAERIWAAVGFVVIVSIVVHGIAVTPIMRRLDRDRKAAEPA